MKGRITACRSGFVEKKGPQGPDIAIRMGGVSGVALDVAGRHATVFELTPGAPEEIRDLIERVEAAAARYGRAGKIRFALPVLLAPSGSRPATSDSPSGRSAFPAASEGSRSAARLCRARHQRVHGERRSTTRIPSPSFARDIAPVFQRTVPFQTARRDFPTSTRPGQWAS